MSVVTHNLITMGMSTASLVCVLLALGCVKGEWGVSAAPWQSNIRRYLRNCQCRLCGTLLLLVLVHAAVTRSRSIAAQVSMQQLVCCPTAQVRNTATTRRCNAPSSLAEGN
jgi:hypothetical protein